MSESLLHKFVHTYFRDKKICQLFLFILTKYVCPLVNRMSASLLDINVKEIFLCIQFNVTKISDLSRVKINICLILEKIKL